MIADVSDAACTWCYLPDRKKVNQTFDDMPEFLQK
jgi:hypothetical protein